MFPYLIRPTLCTNYLYLPYRSSEIHFWKTKDKRKLAPKDAATTCRDATHVLQEAIQQLSAAANVFDGQAAKANEAPVVQGPVAANVVAAPVAQARQREG